MTVKTCRRDPGRGQWTWTVDVDIGHGQWVWTRTRTWKRQEFGHNPTYDKNVNGRTSPLSN
jgi:hypothetical protein